MEIASVIVSEQYKRYQAIEPYVHFTGRLSGACIKNFAPQNPATVKKYAGLQSPAEQLNGKRYHDCWLQNLLISASLGGFRGAPLNS